MIGKIVLKWIKNNKKRNFLIYKLFGQKMSVLEFLNICLNYYEKFKKKKINLTKKDNYCISLKSYLIRFYRNTNIMNKIKKFFKERSLDIKKMNSDKYFKELTMKWIKKSIKYKYVYNFTWMGRPIIKYPNDMIVMQEIFLGSETRSCN